MDCVEDSEKWLSEKLRMFGCSSTSELTQNKCKAPVKEELASTLLGALVFMSKLHGHIREMDTDTKDLQLVLEETMAASDHASEDSSETMELQRKLIKSQESVVQLQQQLLQCKDEQLRAVTTSVKSSVQETVKEEFKTYSSVVKSGQKETDGVTSSNIASIVKKVVEEEDRSRNIMMFGLAEEGTEDLNEKVNDVMHVLGEKPKMDVSRLGKSKDGRPRPVKITLSSSLSVAQILSKSRRLEGTEKFKTVFLSSDKSYEQRAEYRTLVDELKKKKAAEPDKRHYIHKGTVHSKEKT